MLTKNDVPDLAFANVWARTLKGDEDECWEYVGYYDKDGYGRYHFAENCERRTHRIVFVYKVGDIPDNLNVLHKCDNPPCCNPKHLFLGTTLVNNRDALAKGRNNSHFPPAQGQLNGNAKLTQAQVDAIRKEFRPRVVTIAMLATKYKVSKSMISKIVNHVSW